MTLIELLQMAQMPVLVLIAIGNALFYVRDLRREREWKVRMDRMEFHNKLIDSILVKERRMQKQTYMAFWQEPPLDMDLPYEPDAPESPTTAVASTGVESGPRQAVVRESLPAQG